MRIDLAGSGRRGGWRVSNWQQIRERSQNILAFDPENTDALGDNFRDQHNWTGSTGCGIIPYKNVYARIREESCHWEIWVKGSRML